VKLKDIILEKDESGKRKQRKEKKIIFREFDPSQQSPFPPDVVSSLEREISRQARDYELDWNSPIELVTAVFEENSIPIPGAHLKKRFDQYLDLLKSAISDLADARGFKADWNTSF
jgi:hypothetical protein